MKNKILLILLLVLIVITVRNEPIEDTIDAIGGATNATYDSSIDGESEASSGYYDDDDDEHEEDDD